MVLPSVSVNYLSILVAAVVAFVFGWIWHGLLFGKAWMKEMKFSDKDMKKSKENGMAKPMIWNFVGLLVLAYVIAMFVGWLPLTGAGDALMFAFWIWLGFFAASTLLNSVIWEMKSVKLFAINAGYWLINLGLVSYILFVWQ